MLSAPPKKSPPEAYLPFDSRVFSLRAEQHAPPPPLPAAYSRQYPPMQAPIVHPDKIDLFPGVSRGGGFQLWAPSGKGPPLRAPPGDTLPELDATDGRHIIGKVCAVSVKPHPRQQYDSSSCELADIRTSTPSCVPNTLQEW